MEIKGQKVDQNKRTSQVFYINFPLIYIMSRVEGKLELQLMRGYEEQFRERLVKKVSLSYDCLPVLGEEYKLRVSQILEEMKLIDPSEKDLSQHDEIILGRIEGQSILTNFKEVIQSMVGLVTEEKIKAYLKQKTQQRTYGLNGKDKMCIVRQVKKLQCLKKYFNLSLINKKRKFNKLYSIALKNLSKYFDLYEKIDQTNVDTIKAAFEQYTNYTKEDKKFNNFVKQLQSEDFKSVVEKSVVANVQEKSSDDGIVNVIIMEEQKVEQYESKQSDSKGQQSPMKSQIKPKQQKRDNKTQKKQQKTNKKQTKTSQHTSQQGHSAEIIEKQKVQSQEKQQKQKQKAPKKDEKQKAIKKATITNNKAITDFFKKKDNTQQTTLMFKSSLIAEGAPTIVQGQHKSQGISNKAQSVGVKNAVWEKFSQKNREQQQKREQTQQKQQISIPLIQLRSQFRSLPMQSQQYSPESYYTNIIMSLSTLEYFDYFMPPSPLQINFSKPFERIDEVLYFEDESEEFEGESANQEQEEEEEMEENSVLSENNTILSNDYLSNEELSSCEPYEVDLKVEYGKAYKWVFGQANRIQSEDDTLYVVNTFSMICLQDHMPLSLQQQEDNSNRVIITHEMWRDVYKMAHGYYGTKQSIVKEITTLLPGVSKTWIDSMLKQRSEKLLNQRFIKKQFIQDIKQKVPEIQQLLQNILIERNQQLKKLKAQKNYQKDQKLQKDILQCTGSRYMVNLLKQLKVKGYKQLRRNQLIQFINQRRGEEWEKIKIQIHTMSKPIDQMFKNMNHEDRIDQEVVVEDEEYNNGARNEWQVHGQKNTKIEVKIEGQKKSGKKGLKEKQQKNKIKKLKQMNNPLLNMYQKTKPINRARKTKNSLKTGIPSIQELKKQKQQQKQEVKEQQNENENDRENNDDVKEDAEINNQDSISQSVEQNELADEQDEKIDSQNIEQKEVKQQQPQKSSQQFLSSIQKDELKQSSNSINPAKSNDTVTVENKSHHDNLV